MAESPTESEDNDESEPPHFVPLPDNLLEASDEDTADLATRIWEDFLKRHPDQRLDEEP